MGEYIYVLMNDKTGHRLSYMDPAATWVRIPDRTTAKVTAVILDGAIYAFCNSAATSSIVERLDPSDGTWVHVTDKQKPCHATSIVAALGAIYCIGGNNRAAIPDFLSYDPIASSWTELPPMPTARYFAAAVELNGKIYVMGGYTNTYVRNVESYDCESQVWTTISNMNHTRYEFGACVLGEKIYVVGGTQSGNTIEVFDPYENTWNVIETMTGKDIHPEASLAVNLFT